MIDSVSPTPASQNTTSPEMMPPQAAPAETTAPSAQEAQFSIFTPKVSSAETRPVLAPAQTEGNTQPPAETQAGLQETQPQRQLTSSEQQYLDLQSTDPLFFARNQEKKLGYYETLRGSSLTSDQIAQIEENFRNSPPEEVAEYVNKTRMLVHLHDTGFLRDAEMKDWEKTFEDMPLDGDGGILDQYEDFYPDFILVDPNLSAAPESTEPIPFDAQTAPAAPEKAPPTVESVVMTELRKKGWEAFAKEFYPDGVPTDETELAECKRKFEEFYNTNYLPKFTAGEYDEDAKKLDKKLKDLGMSFLVSGITNSDPHTFWTNLLVHSTYGAGNDRIFNYESEVDGTGTGVDINKFKEMCNWSTDSAKSKDNKKKWMYLAALMQHELTKVAGSDSPTNLLKEWAENENALTESEVKAHMELLYTECVKKGKSEVNKALRAALDNQYNNYLNEKPGFREDCHATSDLLTHFEMMAKHHDYLQNFFS